MNEYHDQFAPAGRPAEATSTNENTEALTITPELLEIAHNAERKATSFQTPDDLQAIRNRQKFWNQQKDFDVHTFLKGVNGKTTEFEAGITTEIPHESNPRVKLSVITLDPEFKEPRM